MQPLISELALQKVHKLSHWRSKWSTLIFFGDSLFEHLVTSCAFLTLAKDAITETRSLLILRQILTAIPTQEKFHALSLFQNVL